MSSPEFNWLELRVAAELLDLDASTLRRWCRYSERGIVAHKEDGRWYVDPAWVEQLRPKPAVEGDQ